MAITCPIPRWKHFLIPARVNKKGYRDIMTVHYSLLLGMYAFMTCLTGWVLYGLEVKNECLAPVEYKNYYVDGSSYITYETEIHPVFNAVIQMHFAYFILEVIRQCIIIIAIFKKSKRTAWIYQVTAINDIYGFICWIVLAKVRFTDDAEFCTGDDYRRLKP
jgi:hypothetical protein